MQEIDQYTQQRVNTVIMNDWQDLRPRISLASICRRLRACVEPAIYKTIELDADDKARSKHIDLILKYPHILDHVRCLSFDTTDRHNMGVAYTDAVCLAYDIAVWTGSDCVIAPEKDYGQHITSQKPGWSIWRYPLSSLFLCPNVRSFKLVLDGNKNIASQDGKLLHCLLDVLVTQPNDVWTAARIPGLSNLREFSLIWHVPPGLHNLHYGERWCFDSKNLLPFLLLPSLRTFYTAGLYASLFFGPADEYAEISKYRGKSSVTTMTFDLCQVQLRVLQALLELPKALESLTYAYHDEHFSLDTLPRGIGRAMLCQRQSLKTLVIRGHDVPSEVAFGVSPSAFPVLESLTIPLWTLLRDELDEHEPSRRLVDTIPTSLIRLELLAYDHIPISEWASEVELLLEKKAEFAPHLTLLQVEYWTLASADSYDTQAAAAQLLIQQGQQLGVKVEIKLKKFLISKNNTVWADALEAEDV